MVYIMAEYSKYGVRYGKKHMVIKATTKPAAGVKLGDKEYKFNSMAGNAFYLNDSGVAKEIDREWGAGKGGTGDVVVIEKEMREPGHTYRFWHSGVPWDKKDDGRWEEYAPGKWRLKVCQ